jgi:hypothetical protein
MRLPDRVFATLRQVAAKYPGPASDETLAKVLNEVAWTHRAEPLRNADGEVIGVLKFGLSEKTGGRHIVHPQLGRIAEDILQLPDGTHWDVFTSAGHGNPLRPNQGESIVPNTPRRWVEPVKPEGEILIPGEGEDPPEEPVEPPKGGECQCKCGAVLEVVSRIATRGESDAAKETLYQLIAKVLIGEHIASLYQRLDRIEQALRDMPKEGCKVDKIKIGDLF